MTTTIKCLAFLEGPGLVRVYEVEDTPRLRSDAEDAIERIRAKSIEVGYAIQDAPSDIDPAQYGLASTVAFCVGKERDDVAPRYVLGLWILRQEPFFSVRASFDADGVVGHYSRIENEETFEITHEHIKRRLAGRTPADGAHRLIF